MKIWLKYLQQGLARKMPDDRLAGEPENHAAKANLKNLYPYVKGHWCQGLVGFLLILAGAISAFPPPLITRFLVDDVILKSRPELLALGILLLAGCLVAEKLARFLEDFYFARFAQQVILDFQKDLLARILRFPKSFFDNHPAGYVQSRLSEEVDELRWFFSGTIVHAASNVLRFIGGIVFLFYLEWKMALAVLIVLPAIVWCIRYFSIRIHVLSHQSMEQKAEASGRLQESLSEATLIKSFATEDHTLKRLLSAVKNVLHTSLEQTTVNALAGLVTNSMPGMARLITLAVGAFWIIKGQWSLGSLLAFQMYLAYVFGPVQLLASTNLQFQKALAALQRVFALFDILPEDDGSQGKTVTRLKGEIEFENVTFSYNGYEPVLENVSLRIAAGERVALVGPSGGGKTTLLSLILRFYQPRNGNIFFDGRPVSELDLSSLRTRIGYVAQQPRLVSGTILENLRYGNSEAGDDRVVWASRTAGIHEFIRRLPDGYDTVIAAGGVKFSEGQRQRIALARALIKDPDILILDEPSAALDSVSEKNIFEALPSLINGKTLIVASHRPSIVKSADRILLLNAKRLGEIENYDNLHG